MAKTPRRSTNTPQVVLRSLAKGEVANLYWFYGVETYLVDRLLDALKKIVLAKSPRGFNFDLFLGKETSVSVLLQAAKTLPMMAEKRLVLVKDAQDIKAQELEKLLPYLEKPSQETTLAFISDKVDKRTKFFQKFQKTGLLVECKPLYEKDIPGWVLEEAKEIGFTLSPEAINALVQIVGSTLGTLRSALEKISLFIAPRKEATEEDIFSAVADTRARSVFELTQAIGERNLGKSLSILTRLTQFEKGEVAIPLLGTIAWQWRQLIRGSILKAKGLPRGEILKELGVYFRQSDQFWSSLHRFEARELREKHKEIVKTDLALKSSPLSNTTLLERLIMQLCT